MYECDADGADFNLGANKDKLKWVKGLAILTTEEEKKQGVDLTGIGGAEHAGVMNISMDITKVKTALMINESPTGLTSQVSNLHEIQPK